MAAAAVILASCAPGALEGLPSATISIDDHSLRVAVADTPAARAQGLMGITDLGGLDGMLFVFDSDTESGFWMKDTPMPLDIAFFDADGRLVDRFSMQPCTADSCRHYHPGGSYRYAVEAPLGELSFVGGQARLTLGS
jgi:hypothetical protein